MVRLSILLFLTMNAISVQGQDYVFNLIGQTFMVPDLNKMKFNQGDTIIFGKDVFVKRDSVYKFIPKGWSIPDLDDIKLFIKNLDGNENSTGGKEVSASYLSSIIPFRLNGIYYSSMNKAFGKNTMTAFYTSPDILWSSNDEPEKLTQVSLHIYSARNGNLNVEPTYTRVENGVTYSGILFIKK